MILKLSSHTPQPHGILVSCAQSVCFYYTAFISKALTLTISVLYSDGFVVNEIQTSVVTRMREAVRFNKSFDKRLRYMK